MNLICIILIAGAVVMISVAVMIYNETKHYAADSNHHH